jgi:hypothetical protein
VSRRRWGLVAAALTLVLLAGGTLAWRTLPELLRRVLVWRLEAATGRAAAVDRLELDLSGGRLRIEGLRLADREPGPPLAELAALELRFHPRALVRGRLVADAVSARGLRVRLVRGADGRLNVADLLARRQPATRPAPVSIARLELSDGELSLEDRSLAPPRSWRAEGVGLRASELSTLDPAPRGTARLEARVAGLPIGVEISRLALAPLQLEGRLTLPAVDAGLASLHLPPGAPVGFDGGWLSLLLTARVDPRDGTRLEGEGRLEGVAVRRRPSGVGMATLDSIRWTVALGAPPGEALRLERAEVAGRATLHDIRRDPPGRHPIEPFRLLVTRAPAPPAAPARLQLQAGLPGTGGVRAEGTLRLDPVAIDLRARLARVDLAFWGPQVPLPVSVAGLGDADLVLELRPAGTRVSGQASLRDLAVADGEHRLARARRVEATGLDLRWPDITIERLRLERPGVLLRRDARGRFALPAGAGGGSPAPAGTAGPRIEIGEIAVDGGRVLFRDESLAPAARLRLGDVKLAARDVTWPPRRRIQLELGATTPGAGALQAQGAVGLEPLAIELRARLAGVALAPYRPYVPLPAQPAGRLHADLTVEAGAGPSLALRMRGTAALEDLSFADGDRPVLTVGRIEGLGLDYRWPAALGLERLRVQRGWAMIERRRDGSFPLRTLFAWPRPARAAADAPAAGPPPPAFELTVREGRFEEGAATIVDATVEPAARFQVAGVQLTARDLGWPARAPVPVTLEAPTPGGGVLRARGEVALERPRLDLQVGLQDVALGPLQPYLPVRGRLSGAASGALRVTATVEPLAIAATGTLALADLAMADEQRPLLTLGRLEAAGLDYRWPATLLIDRLTTERSWARIERRPDGSFPLRDLFTARPGAAARPGARPAAAGRAPATGPTVDVRVRRAVLGDGAASIVDGQVRPAARLEVGGARLEVQDFSWPARGPVGLQLRTPTPGGGTLEARGQLRLDAQRLEATLALQGVALGPATPYVLSRGSLAGRADGELRVAAALAPPALSLTGRLEGRGLELGDGQRRLLAVEHLEAAGLDVQWPDRLAAGRLVLRRPWALLERDARGGFPLLALLAAGPPAPDGAGPGAGGPPPPRPAATPRPRLRVEALAVEDGFVRVVDATVRPRFVEELSALALSVQGLGTGAATPSEVALTTRLIGGVPLALRGRVGPLGGPLALDLRGSLSELPLPRLNGYANQLVGWIARKGALSLEVHYRVTDDRLEARNELLLAQPEVAPSRRGDEVRRRVGIPLGLLITLLKNARGEVRLSVPVTGRVSARQFDVQDAVWEGVRQTVIKVLALPVSWIGKIFYTEDARIDTLRIWPVSFEPGTTRFRRGFDRHAERLGTFLREAPGVALTLSPVVTLEDLAALRRAAVQARLEAGARETGQPVAAVGARLFAERFPERPAPAEPEAVLEALASAEVLPDDAVAVLAARRVEVTRQQIDALGPIAAGRLRVDPGPVPVEAGGHGRVEFEIGP